MKLSFTAIGLFIMLSFTSYDSKCQTNKAAKEQQDQTSIKKTYKLKGFKQSCCAGIITYSLKEVEGFIKSEPNVKKQELSVWYDRTKCTEADIKEAINKTKYKVLKTKSHLD